jgi:hypothetical protein
LFNASSAFFKLAAANTTTSVSEDVRCASAGEAAAKMSDTQERRAPASHERRVCI